MAEQQAVGGSVVEGGVMQRSEVMKTEAQARWRRCVSAQACA